MTTPDMHAALARLVNNEQTRKQEKIDQSLPKRSSREAELSPRGAAPRLVKRQRPPAIAAPPPPADSWPVPAPPSQPVPQKRTLSGKPRCTPTAKETVLVGSETRSFVEGLELSGVVIGRHTREALIDFLRRGCDWCAKEDARS